ncbi:MAG TPA: ECF transporter S component [Firmicutes bacterium]|nr:ECF transporter S component [Candidatus Fermentithermobacillaceae bacterium]
MRRLAQIALFVATGIVLPMAFHAVGMGRAFLPMHIPVLLAGIYGGWKSGLVVGAVTPILSGVLTGMPPLVPPTAFAMMVELPVYGVLVALFYKQMRIHPALSLGLAALVGRMVYGLIGYAMFPLVGLPKVSPLYPVTTGLLASLPGVVLQVILVPLIVSRTRAEE